jgi:hypothetical protein
MPHQLAQLADLGRGDPRLGESAHPQQVGQIRGIAQVVLHPPLGKALDPQRVRQVHPGTGLGEHVRSPVG